MRGKRKKHVKTKDCIAVLSLFESAGLDPKSIIRLLDRATAADEIFLSMYRSNAIRLEDIQMQIDAAEMEKDNIYAQMLVSVLRIALMEGHEHKYITPSLN